MAEGDNPRICPHCGNRLPAGATHCPHCNSRLSLILHSRETVLSLTAAIVIVLFFLTGFITRGYHEKLAALGEQWFEAGEQQLKSGAAGAALEDFHTALVYRPDDAQIQFRLAEALAADHRDGEARAYLLGLLARNPSDAPINLALARISATNGSEAGALRYYHGAIYGVWPKNPETNRLNARLELSRFLVGRNDTSIADAELIALISEIPQHGAELHAQAGDLFLRIGDAKHALSEFRSALTVKHPSANSVRGAGLAAYQLGEYQEAERYLERAQRLRTSDADVTSALVLSRLVISADPYLRGLSDAERRARTQRDFAQAFFRLRACAKKSANVSASAAPQSDLAMLTSQAKALQPRLTERNLRLHPSQVNVAMILVFAMEDAATKECGEAQGIDEALTLIGKFHQGGER
ncbi:MAG: tetratricopeptide repeat protein [Candidatus Acidiferrales bacterium]